MSHTPGYQRFLADLKRRQVFRVAAVYGAAAFVVIQAADVIFPRIPLPDWTVSLVVWLAILGFPVAIAISWVFEVTPEGLRRTDEASEAQLEEIVTRPARSRWPAGLAALVGIGLLVGGGWWALQGPLAGGTSYDSIAVLPFTDLSGQEENEFFGDGLAEELLNALAGIEGLKVAARTSAFSFKDSNADIREIAEALDVETVLEGSVRRSADRLRITAQLIDARTGYHLWSKEYDRDPADIFAVQDEIAGSITDALVLRLSGTEIERLYRGGTDDVEAYELYLTGRQKWVPRDIPQLHEAIVHFEQAIARDSGFALAWSGLADALDALIYRVPEERDRLPEARYAAQRALVLEPELAEGWASLGVLALDFDRDWTFAELALRRAIELKPSYSTPYHWLGDVYRYSGRVKRSKPFSRRAVELDPISGTGRDGKAFTDLLLGQLDEARDEYQIILDMGFDPTGPAANLVTFGELLGFDADQLAEYAVRWARFSGWAAPEEAEVIGRAVLDPALREQALDLLNRMEEAGVSSREIAEMTLALGDTESAMLSLERAAAAEDASLFVIGVDPVYDPLREDPRMISLTRGLGLPNGYDPDHDHSDGESF
jgi:TolB-like protein